MDLKKILAVLVLIIVLIAGAFVLYLQRNKISNNDQSPQKTAETDRSVQQITIENQTITDNTNPFVIKITYPQIAGFDDFNQKAKAIVDKEISDFKSNSLANDEVVKQVDPVNYAKYPRTYELDMGYDKGETDSNIVSVIFNVYNFEGGAHGTGYFVPLNYNVKTNAEIKLADLFLNQSDYLQKISNYCTTDLTKQLIDKLGSIDGTYLQEGAGPNADNFQFFLINKDSIVFYFPQYQVAFGAAGDFKVIMSRSPNN